MDLTASVLGQVAPKLIDMSPKIIEVHPKVQPARLCFDPCQRSTDALCQASSCLSPSHSRTHACCGAGSGREPGREQHIADSSRSPLASTRLDLGPYRTRSSAQWGVLRTAWRALPAAATPREQLAAARASPPRAAATPRARLAAARALPCPANSDMQLSCSFPCPHCEMAPSARRH